VPLQLLARDRSFAGIMTGIAQEGGRPMSDMRRRDFITLLGGRGGGVAAHGSASSGVSVLK
jgi:hypothetical protein